MSLENVPLRLDLDRRERAKVLFEHFRFRRAWCPVQGSGCNVVVHVVNGIESEVRQCSLQEGRGELTCGRECLRHAG